MPEPTLTTVGHGTLEQKAFAGLLTEAGLHDLIDIRSFPGSRRNPQFGRERMEHWLPEADITYTWMDDLGGRRKPVPDSPHVVWRHPSFRAYADYMESSEFAAAIDELLDGAGERVVMCSESVWWRCHRRLVADYAVLVRGRRVDHLMHDGRRMEHRPTDRGRATCRRRVDLRRRGDHSPSRDRRRVVHRQRPVCGSLEFGADRCRPPLSEAANELGSDEILCRILHHPAEQA